MGLADHRLTFGRLQVYVDPRDAWVGAYVAPDALFVCPLPFLVFRWWRSIRSLARRGVSDREIRADAARRVRTQPAEIWIDRGRQGGQPCVYGTRLPITTLAGYADGCNDKAALDAYPWATAHDLEAARWFLEEWHPLWACEEPGEDHAKIAEGATP